MNTIVLIATVALGMCMLMWFGILRWKRERAWHRYCEISAEHRAIYEANGCDSDNAVVAKHAALVLGYYRDYLDAWRRSRLESPTDWRAVDEDAT